MNAIVTVFPTTSSHICIWHVNKNILVNCRKKFSTEEEWDLLIKAWNVVLFSHTEASFTSNWTQFCLNYSAYPAVVAYITEQWLPYKEKIIKCFTDKHLHFNNRATSRVEGNHNHLKNNVNLVKATFFTSFLVFERLVLGQLIELKAHVLSDRIKRVVGGKYDTQLFDHLHAKVSHYALKRIHQQLMIEGNIQGYIKQLTQQIRHPALDPSGGPWVYHVIMTSSIGSPTASPFLFHRCMINGCWSPHRHIRRQSSSHKQRLTMSWYLIHCQSKQEGGQKEQRTRREFLQLLKWWKLRSKGVSVETAR